MESFRRAVKGWLGITMLAILALPLVLVGMESYFSGGQVQEAAEVNGEPISQTLLDRAYQTQLEQVQSRLGPDATLTDEQRKALRGDVLNNLIERELLRQAAVADGYQISDAQVMRLIQSTPAFQVDGRFSRDQYLRLLMQIGETPQGFPQRARAEILAAQRINGVIFSSFVTPRDIDRLLALDGQQRDVRWVTFAAADYADQVTVTDADIQQAYTRENLRFQQPEQVRLALLRLTADRYADTGPVTEAELKARYDERVQALGSSESRRASHILLTGDDALARAQALRARLVGGASFADLAKELSQDPGSAAQGGDLDYSERGQFEPAFEAALFALPAPGALSEPVTTPFGVHLIQLTDIRRPTVPSLDSLRDTLTQEIRQARAEAAYAADIERLDGELYEASDLTAAAESVGVTVTTTPWLTRQGLPGVLSEARLLETAFSDELVQDRRNSTALTLADGSTLWARVVQHQPARKQPLAEVKDVVRAQLIQDRSLVLAQRAADALKKSVTTLADQAQRTETRNLLRSDNRLDRALQEALFQAAAPNGNQPVLSVLPLANQVVVAEVLAVRPGAVTDERRSAMRSPFAENRGQQELGLFVRLLRDEAKVVLRTTPSAN